MKRFYPFRYLTNKKTTMMILLLDYSGKWCAKKVMADTTHFNRIHLSNELQITDSLSGEKSILCTANSPPI